MSKLADRVIFLAFAMNSLQNICKAQVIEPMLINGREASPGDFPEVVLTSNGSGRCTGTLIGPRVLISAAHCTRGGTIFEFQVNQNVHRATMTNSPNWNPSQSGQHHDIALGVLDRPVSESLRFASVGDVPETGSTLTIAGYGCTRVGGTGGNDGKLRYGNTKVSRISGFEAHLRESGGVILCMGDSGGPTFGQLNNPASEHHYIVGVNSAVSTDWNESYVMTTGHQLARSFIDSFIARHNVEICGINRSCDGSPGPQPPPPGPQPPPGPEPSPQCVAQRSAVRTAQQGFDRSFDQLKTCMF